MSDRILVMYEGEIVGEFDPKEVTVEELAPPAAYVCTRWLLRPVLLWAGLRSEAPDPCLSGMTVASKRHKNNAVNNVSLQVKRGEIVCIAGIDGNGQTEFVYGLSGLEPLKSGTIIMNGTDITHMPIPSPSEARCSDLLPA